MLDYEGLTVRDLKRIVNRGEASPAAIGLFVVYDYWEREHGRKSIVDNKLLRHIESKWAYTAYANELDFWLELAGQLRLLELQAIARANKAQISLLRAEGVVSRVGRAFYASWYRAIYEEATELGLKLTEPPERYDMAEEAASDLPSLEEIEDAAEDIRTTVAEFLGYVPIMGAVGALLGIPLEREILVEGVALAPYTERQKARLEQYSELAEHWPDVVEALKKLIPVGSVRPSPAVMSYVEGVIGAYLSKNWRAWARAGVSLREQAESSKGVVDLIRRAELAAAELSHE